uniref:GTPase HRas-like n=1 Tax=Phascolarctos cinereus TaxID=38626 RepID=A0A6P5JID3_PHACI|nr:GTPase HRas-like [Phascolarctos cinereus]
MYKLVVMGSCGVGKSVLSIHFLQNRFVAEYEPTARDLYHGVAVVDREPCELDILAMAGDEKYFEQGEDLGEGFLCIYTIDYIKTFVEVNFFQDQLQKVKGTTLVPMVLMANKINEAHWLVDLDMGSGSGQKPQVALCESLGQDLGMEHTFKELVREILQMHTEEKLKGH